VRKIGISLAEVDASKIVEDSNEFLVVPAIIAREGVFPYPEGKAFKPAAELKEAAWTAEGAWIVAEKHPDTVILTVRDDIKGKVENTKFCDKVNGILGNLRFFKAKCDAKFLDEIKTGKRKDVSLGFFYDFDATPGKWKDQTYDFVQRNILVDHVAAGVPVGRCRSPYCGIAVDSLIRKVALDPEETENYIHIPVRDASGFVDDSFRTIDIDADNGIKAVIGKLKSDPEGSTHVQKFLFAKGKDWTMEKAQAWVNEHKKSADAASGLTSEEIKEKIQELVAQRDRIMDKLYPKTTLTQEEQEKARTDLTIIDAQMRGIEEFVAQKFVGGAAGDAVWDTEYINNLQDSAFAYIEDGGKKDDQGKTVPRSLRHLPFKNAEGEIDHDHLVNALARVKQSATMPEGGKTAAIEKLCSAVRSWNKVHPDSKIESEVCGTEASADAFCEIERARRLLSS
jgi:polyhydroxyalkanoate synthesis regulator phasin